MNAQYWTTDGIDMWRLKERRVFDFENLDTKEVVSCDVVSEVMDRKFTPVIMPVVKKQKSKKAKSSLPRGQKVKNVKVKEKAAKTSRRRPGTSKHKGVRVSGKKFTAQWWDGKNKKVRHLGTFDSELLAAAAVQEEHGNHNEARRLRNEYEEGDRRPEAPEAVHKRIFPEDRPNPALRPMKD